MGAVKILLVDLNSILHPIWHMSGSEPDVDFTSRATVDKVRALANGYDHVAICCDSRKSIRKETISADYKANRPPTEERLLHQIRLSQETLAKDGFPVWNVDGYEADDIIATAVARAAELEPEPDVVIASSDKDLLQLVSEHVTALSIKTGLLLGPAEVAAKFVPPAQIRDYLCLVGDASDNVKGVPGIGDKRAKELLKRHGSLQAVYEKMANGKAPFDGVTPAMFTALQESVALVDMGRRLVSLFDNLPIPFADILAPRVTQPLADPAHNDFEEQPETEEQVEIIDEQTGEVKEELTNNGASAPNEVRATRPREVKEEGASQATIVLRPPSWELALEPTNASAAYKMAEHIFNSRLFGAFPNADAVWTAILMGRTLGIEAVTMLRNVHIIEGKITLAAPLIVGLVLKSGKADYFKCVKSTNEIAVYKTHRKDDPDTEATTIEYTIEDAKRQQLLLPLLPDKKPGNWHKIPKTMLRHRCSTELARAVYPDVVAGLYSPDEFGAEVKVQESAA